MRSTICLFGLLGACAASVAAQGAGASPDVKPLGTVWSAYLAALGGTEKWGSIGSWQAEADYSYEASNQRGRATASSYWSRPARFYQVMVAPFGRMERGYNGENGWGQHPETGIRRMDSQELLEARRDAAFYQPIAFLSDYSGLRLAGRLVQDGRTVDVVEGTLKRSGRTERIYFDADTHLPNRLEVWEGGPEGERQPGEYLQARFELSDYRSVDGVMIPHVIRRIRPNSSIDYRIRVLRFNVVLPDSLFRSR